MILNFFHQHKQYMIDLNNVHKNLCHLDHNYKIGDEILILTPKEKLSKLANHATGPYRISHVQANGTITIHKGNLFEHINICQIKP